MGARALIERSSHRIVFRRRLPAPFRDAHIYTSSEGGLRYLKPRLDNVDPPLLGLVSECIANGNVVWDIGANVGLFSLAAAVASGSTGHVLAVEPDAVLVTLLRRSAAANPRLGPVEVLPTAVADRIGVSSFHIARRNRSTSHLAGFGTTQTGGTRHVELVPTITLDWLLDQFPVPDVVKIDVEAAELLVLSGGARLLAARPTIICEVAAANAAAVHKILSDYGYVLYDGDERRDRRVPVSTAPELTLARCPT